MSSTNRAKRRQAERKLRRDVTHAEDHERQPPSTVLPTGQFVTGNRATRRRYGKPAKR